MKANTLRRVLLFAMLTMLWHATPRSAGAATITGSGTIGYVPMFTGSATIGNGPAQQVSGITGALFIPGGEQVQPTTDYTPFGNSYYSSLYGSTYSQETDNINVLNLSAAISETGSDPNSFRDAFYSQITDADATSTYTYSHSNYAGRFAAFGPYSGGAFQISYKNIVGLNAYAYARTYGNTLAHSTSPPGVAGINTDAVQYGEGISDNEFAAHNPNAASGGQAQSKSMAAAQAILDANYADADSTHTAYAVLATNIGTKLGTAAYGASGPGKYLYFLAGNSAVVTQAGINMPGSNSAYAGTIIDYGINNGAPAGGSWTDWQGGTNGGQFRWIDSGVVIAQLDTSGLILPSVGVTPGGKQPMCIDTSTKRLYYGSSGAC